jgi:sugar O-acyltransferase (sialic acid O-acetyltransferase NeuD family)
VATDLVIVGAGGSSREIGGAVAEINRNRRAWNLLGFFDDDPEKAGTLVDGLPVLGPIEHGARYPHAQFVIGVASFKNPSARRKLAERLQLPPERFATIIHPSASVSAFAKVGHGTAILQGVVVTSATLVGNHVLISQGALLGHDITVHDFVTLAPGAVVSGSVTVEESVYIGARAVVAPGVTIGKEALVGVGAVAISAVPANTTVFGNPARVISGNAESLRRWTK